MARSRRRRPSKDDAIQGVVSVYVLLPLCPQGDGEGAAQAFLPSRKMVSAWVCGLLDTQRIPPFLHRAGPPSISGVR